MSEKTYNLIVGLTTGVEIIAITLVTFFNPPMAVAINASIPIVCECVKKVCKNFVKGE